MAQVVVGGDATGLRPPGNHVVAEPPAGGGGGGLLVFWLCAELCVVWCTRVKQVKGGEETSRREFPSRLILSLVFVSRTHQSDLGDLAYGAGVAEPWRRSLHQASYSPKISGLQVPRMHHAGRLSNWLR